MGDRSGVRTGAAPGRVLLRRSRGRPRSGQSVAEFALVLPVLVAILGGIIQFGVIFWAQNTLTQVVRDTGRWAATQKNCTAAGPVITEANTIAGSSSLLGYTSGSWNSSNVTVTWTGPTSGTCPPLNNSQVWFVTISINHSVPVFFPGMQYLPGFSGNRVTLSSTATFRMEPSL